jgi:hypothetical protein
LDGNPQFGRALRRFIAFSFHLGRTRIAIARAEYGMYESRPPGGGGAPALLQNLLVRRSRTAHCSLLACSIEPTSVYGGTRGIRGASCENAML